MKCPTETLIPDDQEFELAKLGFAPLANEKNTANAVFFSVNSAQEPKENGGSAGDAATANARLSGQLPYIFAGDYVLKTDGAPEEEKAKKPLKGARIDVVADPRRPGAYQAKIFLQPHFQLDAVDFSMSLVADFPESLQA